MLDEQPRYGRLRSGRLRGGLPHDAGVRRDVAAHLRGMVAYLLQADIILA